jgi:hypothetical protein
MDNFRTMMVMFEGTCSAEDMSTTMTATYQDPMSGQTRPRKPFPSEGSEHGGLEMFNLMPDGSETKTWNRLREPQARRPVRSRRSRTAEERAPAVGRGSSWAPARTSVAAGLGSATHGPAGAKFLRITAWAANFTGRWYIVVISLRYQPEVNHVP